VRTLLVDDVFELIEGPQKESFKDASRVRAKVSSDGAVGWITVRDRHDVIFAKPSDQYFTCTASIAMTDALGIKECKVVKKLVVGEVFMLLEEPVEEESAGVTRVLGRSLTDGKEGFVTVKGNAGTVYAEASTKHYTVVREVALQKGFRSNSEVLRTLLKGEAIEVCEGPRAEKFDAVQRIRGRALSDGVEGWVTLKGENVRPWSPYYKALEGTPITEELASTDVKVLRELHEGEEVECLEGPVGDEAKQMRLKGR